MNWVINHGFTIELLICLIFRKKGEKLELSKFSRVLIEIQSISRTKTEFCKTLPIKKIQKERTNCLIQDEYNSCEISNQLQLHEYIPGRV